MAGCEDTGLIQQRRVSAFEAFVKDEDRAYEEGSAEYELRRDIFDRNAHEVARLNGREERLWTAGINHLSDWAEAELESLFGWRGHGGKYDAVHESGSVSLVQEDGVEIAETHRWNASALKKVDNQGECGSCWALATAKMCEVNYQLKNNKLRRFSPQELVDCVPNPDKCGGDGGCKGATTELAMMYVAKRGLSTKAKVPYKGKTGSCKKKSLKLGHLSEKRRALSMAKISSPGVKHVTGSAAHRIHLTNWERLPVNQEAPLKRALMQGAVAVSVCASTWSFYSHGIYDHCKPGCVVNHAVVAYGFGKDKRSNNHYWHILNSWGSRWGEKGSIRLSNPKKRHCGWDRDPAKGTGCKHGPSKVKICGMCGVLYDNVIARFKKQ